MQDWIETKDDYLDTPDPRLPDREHFAVLLTNLGDIQLPSFIAIDKDGRAVLVAEVKGHPHNFKDTKRRNYALLRLIDILKFATKNLIPFAMLVDKINIEFFRWDGQNLSEPILILNTPDVLTHYEPQFNEKGVYDMYLIGLTELWLGDLASRWKLETPPYKKELQEIGLLQLIEGGTTKTYYDD